MGERLRPRRLLGSRRRKQRERRRDLAENSPHHPRRHLAQPRRLRRSRQLHRSRRPDQRMLARKPEQLAHLALRPVPPQDLEHLVPVLALSAALASLYRRLVARRGRRRPV